MAALIGLEEKTRNSKHFTHCFTTARSGDKSRSLENFSNVEIDHNHTLDLPRHYKGSKMLMPTGEPLYWQAEVNKPPLGWWDDSRMTYQDFEDIRSRCLAEGVLFEDPHFPANNRSLFVISNPLESQSVKWLRPRELVDDPQLCVKGYSRFDVRQQLLGDCWLDAPTATLSMHRKLFERVVPSDQSFNEDYAGVFHFRFWQFGRWVDVVIDDRLPTVAGKLAFLKSSAANEFWSPLLEKAYAKLYGSYEAIVGGLEAEAMEDFTGGLTEIYPVSDDMPKDFFSYLLQAYKGNSLLGASIINKPESEVYGLISDHAYSITCVKYLDSETPLLRIRNPWGTHEWTGAWSDESPEWKLIPQSKKMDLGLTVNDDGEFWMSFEDFTKHFTIQTICNLNPDILYPEQNSDHSHNNKWKMSMIEGEWVKGMTAGGGSQCLESHWRNPQYILTVTESDEGDDECSVVLSLSQKYFRTPNGKKKLNIGFKVYRFDNIESQCHLDEKFFRENKPLNDSMDYFPLRSITARMGMDLGKYVIVPSTENPDEEGEYLIRVLSVKPHNIFKLPEYEKNDIIIDNDIDNNIDNDINNDMDNEI